MKNCIDYDSVNIGDNMKKLLIVGIVLCYSLVCVGCGCSKTDNKEVEKIDETKLTGKFFDNQMIDILEVQNFNIAIDGGESYISFDVKNTSNEATAVEYIKILMYDANDDLVIDSYGYIGGTIAAQETKHVTVDVDISLMSVTRIAYERM